MKIRNFQDSLRTSTSQISIRNAQQEEIRDPPEKIRQNKFTKTYSKLEYIPLNKNIETLNPKNIQHLYLSHNKIKSLSGIQQYENLVSLNVSYNLLTIIQELNFIQKPQNIVRIGLKMNDFIYGYQDYAVYFFKNLQKLDDIDVKDKIKVKKFQQKGNRVANLFLQFHIRTSRLFVFLNDLIKQQKIHQEMKLRRSQKSKMNPKLKLLFQHMTENFIAKISQIYIMPTQEEFLHLSTFQILNKIENAINITLEEEIDLKCTCRPKMPNEEQVKKSFKQICGQFLKKFEQRYNYQLKNGLEKMNKKFNSKQRQIKFQYWELWGKLQNYNTLSLGGKSYQNLTSTIGKNYVQLQNNIENPQLRKRKKSSIQQNEWRNQVFINQQTSQNDKQNLCPNIPSSLESNKNLNKQKVLHQYQHFQMFYDRIPIILYEKNYVEVLLQITMLIIKQILEKYDYLNKVRTIYLQNIQKQKNQQKKFLSLDQIYYIAQRNNTKKHKFYVEDFSNHEKQTKKQNQKCNSVSQTKRISSQRKYGKINDDFRQQKLLKGTVVQHFPSHKADELSGKTTQRKFLKRQESQISFGISRQNQQDFQVQKQRQVTDKNKIDRKNNKKNQKEYSIYEINLIYKVFRSFKIKVVKRKSKRKNKVSQ